MTKNTIYLAFCSLLLISCEEENLNNIAANQFVVEAFLYAGEPVNDIKVKSIYGLSEEEDLSIPIDDAQLTLTKNNRQYPLVSSGADGYYHYPGNDLLVETNDIFTLEVVHNGITAKAQTTVPTPTIGLNLSQDTIKVPQLPFSAGRDSIASVIGSFMRNSRIDATWQNPNNDLYFMVVEAQSALNDPIFPGQVLESLSRFKFVSEPTDDTSLTFLGGSLVSFGAYEVKVYHINREYAALYENRTQDSRDLNQPPSNVENALGVFSAFNSQDESFVLVRDTN